MARSVCLLKGVNVGGKNRLPMASLRELFTSLGHEDVETVIQSGNVIFKPHGRPSAAGLEEAIASEFGLRVPVVLRTASELGRVLQKNPFADADEQFLHVAFLQERPAAAALRDVDAAGFAPERFALVGRDLYLHLPHGMARTKLPATLERRLRLPMTVRNLRTVTTLAERSAA